MGDTRQKKAGILFEVRVPQDVAGRYMLLAQRLGIRGGVPELFVRAVSVVEAMEHETVMPMIWAGPAELWEPEDESVPNIDVAADRREAAQAVEAMMNATRPRIA